MSSRQGHNDHKLNEKCGVCDHPYYSHREPGDPRYDNSACEDCDDYGESCEGFGHTKVLASTSDDTWASCPECNSAEAFAVRGQLICAGCDRLIRSLRTDEMIHGYGDPRIPRNNAAKRKRWPTDGDPKGEEPWDYDSRDSDHWLLPYTGKYQSELDDHDKEEYLAHMYQWHGDTHPLNDPRYDVRSLRTDGTFSPDDDSHDYVMKKFFEIHKMGPHGRYVHHEKGKYSGTSMQEFLDQSDESGGDTGGPRGMVGQEAYQNWRRRHHEHERKDINRETYPHVVDVDDDASGVDVHQVDNKVAHEGVWEDPRFTVNYDGAWGTIDNHLRNVHEIGDDHPMRDWGNPRSVNDLSALHDLLHKSRTPVHRETGVFPLDFVFTIEGRTGHREGAPPAIEPIGEYIFNTDNDPRKGKGYTETPAPKVGPEYVEQEAPKLIDHLTNSHPEYDMEQDDRWQDDVWSQHSFLHRMSPGHADGDPRFKKSPYKRVNHIHGPESWDDLPNQNHEHHFIVHMNYLDSEGFLSHEDNAADAIDEALDYHDGQGNHGLFLDLDEISKMDPDYRRELEDEGSISYGGNTGLPYDGNEVVVRSLKPHEKAKFGAAPDMEYSTNPEGDPRFPINEKCKCGHLDIDHGTNFCSECFECLGWGKGLRTIPRFTGAQYSTLEAPACERCEGSGSVEERGITRGCRPCEATGVLPHSFSIEGVFGTYWWGDKEFGDPRVPRNHVWDNRKMCGACGYDDDYEYMHPKTSGPGTTKKAFRAHYPVLSKFDNYQQLVDHVKVDHELVPDGHGIPRGNLELYLSESRHLSTWHEMSHAGYDPRTHTPPGGIPFGIKRQHRHGSVTAAFGDLGDPRYEGFRCPFCDEWINAKDGHGQQDHDPDCMVNIQPESSIKMAEWSWIDEFKADNRWEQEHNICAICGEDMGTETEVCPFCLNNASGDSYDDLPNHLAQAQSPEYATNMEGDPRTGHNWKCPCGHLDIDHGPSFCSECEYCAGWDFETHTQIPRKEGPRRAHKTGATQWANDPRYNTRDMCFECDKPARYQLTLNHPIYGDSRSYCYGHAQERINLWDADPEIDPGSYKWESLRVAAVQPGFPRDHNDPRGTAYSACNNCGNQIWQSNSTGEWWHDFYANDGHKSAEHDPGRCRYLQSSPFCSVRVNEGPRGEPNPGTQLTYKKASVYKTSSVDSSAPLSARESSDVLRNSPGTEGPLPLPGAHLATRQDQDYWNLTEDECDVCGAAPKWVDKHGTCWDCDESSQALFNPKFKNDPRYPKEGAQKHGSSPRDEFDPRGQWCAHCKEPIAPLDAAQWVFPGRDIMWVHTNRPRTWDSHHCEGTDGRRHWAEPWTPKHGEKLRKWDDPRPTRENTCKHCDKAIHEVNTGWDSGQRGYRNWYHINGRIWCDSKDVGGNNHEFWAIPKESAARTATEGHCPGVNRTFDEIKHVFRQCSRSGGFDITKAEPDLDDDSEGCGWESVEGTQCNWHPDSEMHPVAAVCPDCLSRVPLKYNDQEQLVMKNHWPPRKPRKHYIYHPVDVGSMKYFEPLDPRVHRQPGYHGPYGPDGKPFVQRVLKLTGVGSERWKQAQFGWYDPVRDVSTTDRTPGGPIPTGDAGKGKMDPWYDEADNGQAPPRPGMIYDKKLKKWIQDGQAAIPGGQGWFGPGSPVTDKNKLGSMKNIICPTCDGDGVDLWSGDANLREDMDPRGPKYSPNSPKGTNWDGTYPECGACGGFGFVKHEFDHDIEKHKARGWFDPNEFGVNDCLSCAYDRNDDVHKMTGKNGGLIRDLLMPVDPKDHDFEHSEPQEGRPIVCRKCGKPAGQHDIPGEPLNRVAADQPIGLMTDSRGVRWQVCPQCKGETNLPSGSDRDPLHNYNTNGAHCSRCQGFGWTQAPRVAHEGDELEAIECPACSSQKFPGACGECADRNSILQMDPCGGEIDHESLLSEGQSNSLPGYAPCPKCLTCGGSGRCGGCQGFGEIYYDPNWGKTFHPERHPADPRGQSTGPGPRTAAVELPPFTSMVEEEQYAHMLEHHGYDRSHSSYGGLNLSEDHTDDHSGAVSLFSDYVPHTHSPDPRWPLTDREASRDESDPRGWGDWDSLSREDKIQHLKDNHRSEVDINMRPDFLWESKSFNPDIFHTLDHMPHSKYQHGHSNMTRVLSSAEAKPFLAMTDEEKTDHLLHQHAHWLSNRNLIEPELLDGRSHAFDHYSNVTGMFPHAHIDDPRYPRYAQSGGGQVPGDHRGDNGIIGPIEESRQEALDKARKIIPGTQQGFPGTNKNNISIDNQNKVGALARCNRCGGSGWQKAEKGDPRTRMENGFREVHIECSRCGVTGYEPHAYVPDPDAPSWCERCGFHGTNNPVHNLDKTASDNYLGDEVPNLCPACGEPSDYCQGHGQMGDSSGWHTLQLHDSGIHTDCIQGACEEKIKDESHGSLCPKCHGYGAVDMEGDPRYPTWDTNNMLEPSEVPIGDCPKCKGTGLSTDPRFSIEKDSKERTANSDDLLLHLVRNHGLDPEAVDAENLPPDAELQEFHLTEHAEGMNDHNPEVLRVAAYDDELGVEYRSVDDPRGPAPGGLEPEDVEQMRTMANDPQNYKKCPDCHGTLYLHDGMTGCGLCGGLGYVMAHEGEING